MGLNQAALARIAQAKASQGGNRIRGGRYLLEIKRMAIETKRKGDMFIVEMLVRESAAIEPGVVPNPVGSQVGYVVNLGQDSGPGNAKAYVLALLNTPEDQVGEADFVAALATLCETNQPARGMLIADVTFTRPIQSGKNAGQPFTGHNWQNVAQKPEEIAARRAAQDAKPAK